MVSLDQIKTLEAKVQNAVAYITELKQENSLLQKNLEKYRKRIDELEVLINEYKEDQSAIEEGIKNALLHLDKLEDSIVKPASGKAAPAARAGKAQPAPHGEAPGIGLDDVEGAAVSPKSGKKDEAKTEAHAGAEIKAEDESEFDDEEESAEPEKAPGELDIF
jgi:FtsZ-binding cell division protein ZapB